MATATVPINGRDVDVETLDEIQYMLLTREMRVAQGDGYDNTRRITAIATCYDIIESVIVKPEDRQYLMDLVKTREVTLKDLMVVVRQLHEDEGKGQPTPAVRRGRTTRSKS